MNLITANRRLREVILLGLLLSMTSYQVTAGALPMPLEAELDLVKDVVIGQIARIVEDDVQKEEGVRWGFATVEVKEVLKGSPAKTINFRVGVWVAPEPIHGSGPPRVHKVGDFGIWLIGSDGVIMRYSSSCGFLPEERKADVQQILKDLSERKWSKPVNGLRAWAAVVTPDYHPDPVIIFAVNNASDADIYVPVAQQADITATVVNQDGKSSDYVLSRGEHPDAVFCEKLSPGKTVYLHPDYSFIDLKWKQGLLPGKYSVIIMCKNNQGGEIADGPARRVPVTAWKGELKAPPVELILKDDEKTLQKAP